LAHTKSAKKCIRQIKKRTERNKRIRTVYREHIKLCRDAIRSGNLEQAQSAFKNAMSAISSARSKGVLHKNTARRYISRLNIQLNKLRESLKLNPAQSQN